MAGSQTHVVLVTEGDTWCGFYAAKGLIEHGQFKKVCVGTRHKDHDLVQELKKMGAEIREYPSRGGRFALDERQSTDLFRDIDRMLLVPIHTEDMAECTKMVIQAAEQNKVKGLALWSTLGAGLIGEGGNVAARGGESTLKLFQEFYKTEEYVRQSKIDCTVVLRLGFIMQQFLCLSKVMQNRGVFPLTSRNAKWAPVNIKDVAKGTARLMSHDKEMSQLSKQLCTLTGQRSHSGQDLTDLLNQTLHAKIEFQEVSVDQMREILEKAGHGDTEGERISQKITLGWMDLLHQNKTDVVTQDLEKLLGEKPSEIKAFFEENADAFRPHRVVSHMLRDAKIKSAAK